MTAERDIVEDIVDLNRDVCRRLWSMIHVGDAPRALSPHLIYPEYRDQSPDTDNSTTSEEKQRIRISEQEARFAYAEALTTSAYYYSVETPTQERHVFKNKNSGAEQAPEGGMSARSDMSLYLPVDGPLEKVANVELKFGPPTPAAIFQDVYKLVRERGRKRDLHGNWFHVLKNADKRTFPSLFDKFRTSRFR